MIKYFEITIVFICSTLFVYAVKKKMYFYWATENSSLLK